MASKKKTLVVVESPTKARTLRGFLPDGYEVAASMGHVRDLPESAAEIPEGVRSEEWARLGVNVEADFKPLYVVPRGKTKVVSELRSLLRNADELILATDEDREGESIGWHLLEVLKPKVPVSRIVFHEITPEAIQAALRTPRQVDENLVRAQETRRIVDRLVGYTVSPLLWKKIASGLSAGRVQSVAVYLLVERERERRAFRSGSYWDLKALLAAEAEEFGAQLHSLGERRIASGRDFDEATGRLIEGRDVLLLDESAARSLRERLMEVEWRVGETEEKKSVRRPAPPFTTSTLQQEANRKLRLSARDTMRIAQRLYEEGFITYMRTDSVHLSEQAIGAARTRIKALYGDRYLSREPRQYTTKSKGAQEAHEAIRPAGTEMRPVEKTGLSGREASLYEMIWKRTVATQMADAQLTHVSALIHADDAVFRAAGRRVDFPGFFRAYVEGSDDPNAALEDREEPLPRLVTGQVLGLRDLDALGHETQPPARYTEASLVKKLENEGIGRPSTYASIIGTIIDRGYVDQKGTQLIPTFTAFAVTSLLEKHFSSLVDTAFTAKMEKELDEIAEGAAEWLPYLTEFFLGENGLEKQVETGKETIDPREASTVRLEGLSAPIRIGKYGPFVEVQEGERTITASLPDDVAPGDLSEQDVGKLVRAKTEGPEIVARDSATGEPIYLMIGRFGPYVQLGEPADGEKPRRASLPKGVTPETLTPQMAERLLSLPRTLGEHPESGQPIRAGIGRFGPFVVHDKDFRSLGAGDDVYTVELPRALELLAQPKRSRATAEPLRELGPHPSDGEPILIFAGRYGPYVKHGSVNASLPKGTEAEALTVDHAVRLLAEREGAAKKGGGRKGGTAGRTARSTRAASKKSGVGEKTASAGSKKTTASKKKSAAGTAKRTTKKAAGAAAAPTAGGRGRKPRSGSEPDAG
jgi:DNA topoisomerase I